MESSPVTGVVLLAPRCGFPAVLSTHGERSPTCGRVHVHPRLADECALNGKALAGKFIGGAAIFRPSRPSLIEAARRVSRKGTNLRADHC